MGGLGRMVIFVGATLLLATSLGRVTAMHLARWCHATVELVVLTKAVLFIGDLLRRARLDTVPFAAPFHRRRRTIFALSSSSFGSRQSRGRGRRTSCDSGSTGPLHAGTVMELLVRVGRARRRRPLVPNGANLGRWGEWAMVRRQGTARSRRTVWARGATGTGSARTAENSPVRRAVVLRLRRRQLREGVARGVATRCRQTAGLGRTWRLRLATGIGEGSGRLLSRARMLAG